MVLSITTQKREPDITVIEVAGRVAIRRESGRIEDAVVKALSEGARRIVMDLGQVSWIDSTGIGVVASCFAKASQAGAQLNVAVAGGQVLEVFKATRVDRVIGFFPDIDSACNGFLKAFSAAT